MATAIPAKEKKNLTTHLILSQEISPHQYLLKIVHPFRRSTLIHDLFLFLFSIFSYFLTTRYFLLSTFILLLTFEQTYLHSPHFLSKFFQYYQNIVVLI